MPANYFLVEVKISEDHAAVRKFSTEQEAREFARSANELPEVFGVSEIFSVNFRSQKVTSLGYEMRAISKT